MMSGISLFLFHVLLVAGVPSASAQVSKITEKQKSQLIKRFPKFELADDVRWSVGQIRGPRVLPVRILETA